MNRHLASTRARRFGMLLRRELWEHKGSFIWLPLVVTALVLLLSGATLLLDMDSQVDGVNISGVNAPMLLGRPDIVASETLIRIFHIGLAISTFPVLLALAFAMVFYCLGALYDDRRDRSALFWASLPVCVSETVLSKAVAALVVAPLIAIACALLTLLVNAALPLGLAWFHGGDAWWVAKEHFHFGRMALALLADVPVFVICALPAVGWLLLCSAFARSKPLLWALGLPLALGIVIVWLNWTGVITVGGWAWWRDVALRPFGYLFAPMLTWHDLPAGLDWDEVLLQPGRSYRHLLRPSVWIGALIGVLMLGGAIALRRWREAE